jgi:acyl-[acyl-carrier-protein]-phospholipid O-acyltransferase/long-chain-fatty-acid--[acyl-carrier-protein] ligase
MSEAAAPSATGLPESSLPESLSRDRSFWGMTATQFLGAFNDNLFKQVVLLLCIDFAQQERTTDYQPHAQALFALPFVFFSGFAGFLSDRISKRRIVVICKCAEIGIVMLGTWSLTSGSLAAVFAVLFLLGTHSAFFGPSKYGILPELVREANLPAANGIFLMTTFVGIILGTALAGKLKGFVGDNIFLVGGAYVTVAVTGLMTSLLIRKTPVARPGLDFAWSDLAVSGETLRMFWRDKPLLMALAMYSLFWLIGGLTLPAVNSFGKLQLYRDLEVKAADENTSLLAGFLTVGIAAGCALAGWISGKKIDFRLVPLGCWGMVIGLAAVSYLGWRGTAGNESAAPLLSQSAVGFGSKLLLILMGIGAGVFTVPLQVFLQSRPPADQKGRVIGAMNLVNWIGILFSAQIYAGFDKTRELADAPHSAIFGGTALLLLPVALFYRPRETPRPADASRDLGERGA